MNQLEEKHTTNQNSLESYISPITILLFLAVLILFGMMLGRSASFLICEYFGYSLKETMDSLAIENSIRKRNFIRFSLLTTHIFSFVLPPLVLAYAFFKRKWYKFLGWRKIKFEKFIINTLVGSVLLFASLPLVQYLYFLNKKLPLPEWARTIDQSVNEMIKNLLVTEAPWELVFNIFVIAVIPAIGEEMIFRGVIQKRFEKWFGNAHLAIWGAAAVFSAFHMQLEGFIPRMVLGAVLGYLFYWSKTLWVPILIHFVNNAIQILVMYFYASEVMTIDLEKVDHVPIWGAIISLVLALYIAYFLKRYNSKTISD